MIVHFSPLNFILRYCAILDPSNNELHFLQERLDEISEDLRALTERQEELKASATSENLGLLQQQMDVLKAREAHLRMEREEHARAVARHG